MAKYSSSLRDVAQAAGVSLGTASRALNNKSNVLPTTRALVLKAASDLGYKLQIRLSASVASKINTIGVAVKRDPAEFPSIDPFNYAILYGIEDECQRLGLNMMYASLPVDEYSHALTWSPLLETGEFDALVIVGVIFSDPNVTRHIPSDIPVVLVDSYAAEHEYDMVSPNNFRGAYDATSYLIEQGHRAVGLIGSNPSGREHHSISERRQGYLQALTDHAIEQSYIENSILYAESAYNATVRVIQRAPELTAILTCNDDIAHHVIRAIRDLKLRVPEDISVMGFDDLIVAPTAQPPLTTMRVDKELMGALAVRQLYERAANLDRPCISMLVGTKLVVRDSVQMLVNRQEAMPDTQVS